MRAETIFTTTGNPWAKLAVAVLLFGGVFGCNGAPTDSQVLKGDEENVAASSDAVSGSIALGSTLVTTTSVNFRTAPSSSSSILRVLAKGIQVVTIESTTPQNGFYKVRQAGTSGWLYGAFLNLVSSGTAATGTGTITPLSAGVSGAITRAKSGVGFSYWWGHGRWLASGATSGNKGSCSGSCPSCSHSGSYGADCSGYVAKVWQVPSSNSTLSVDSHPYSTSSFYNDGTYWKNVSRTNIAKADALVYNASGSGHIMLFSSGDGWGSLYSYECKGCAAGCVYNLRTVASTYKAIRRNGY